MKKWIPILNKSKFYKILSYTELIWAVHSVVWNRHLGIGGCQKLPQYLFNLIISVFGDSYHVHDKYVLYPSQRTQAFLCF